jgi:hypothetical protein
VEYSVALELFGADERSLGRRAVAPDWVPAREWARFVGMRRGELPAVSAHPAGSIEPVWDASRGAPYCGAVRVSIPADVGSGASVEIPTSYFAELAQKASRELVADGRLGAGDRYRYRVCAEASRTSQSGSRPGVAAAAIATPIAAGEASLDQALANGKPRDDPARRAHGGRAPRGRRR